MATLMPCHTDSKIRWLMLYSHSACVESLKSHYSAVHNIISMFLLQVNQTSQVDHSMLHVCASYLKKMGGGGGVQIWMLPNNRCEISVHILYLRKPAVETNVSPNTVALPAEADYYSYINLAHCSMLVWTTHWCHALISSCFTCVYLLH